MTYYAWPILSYVLHEQKWFTVLIQIVQTGVSTCNSLIPKGVNYHRVIDRDWVFWGFFSIIATIRFPLALSSLDIYMYSNLMSPLAFGYDPLLLLSPWFWLLPCRAPLPALWGCRDPTLLCCSGAAVQSHSAEEPGSLVHRPNSYHSVTAQRYQSGDFLCLAKKAQTVVISSINIPKQAKQCGTTKSVCFSVSEHYDKICILSY